MFKNINFALNFMKEDRL